MTSAVFAPRARREVAAAVRWIARDNPPAAHRLRVMAIAAAERIGSHPGIGVVRPWDAREPYRFLNLAGYPYVLVYRADLNPPLIVRIVHGARDLPEVLRDL